MQRRCSSCSINSKVDLPDPPLALVLCLLYIGSKPNLTYLTFKGTTHIVTTADIISDLQGEIPYVAHTKPVFFFYIGTATNILCPMLPFPTCETFFSFIFLGHFCPPRSRSGHIYLAALKSKSKVVVIQVVLPGKKSFVFVIFDTVKNTQDVRVHIFTSTMQIVCSLFLFFNNILDNFSS